MPTTQTAGNAPGQNTPDPITGAIGDIGVQNQEAYNEDVVGAQARAQRIADKTQKEATNIVNLEQVDPNLKPQDKTQQQTQQTTSGQDPYAKMLEDNSKQIDVELATYTNQLNQFGATLDAQLQNQIADIQATYTRRKQQMELINANTLAAQTIIGSRSGRQRYATEIQTSILSAEERAGIQRLADLDAEEQRLINEANMAYTEKKFALFNQTWEATQAARQEKTNLIIAMNKMAIDQENLLIQKNREIRDQMQFEMESADYYADSISANMVTINDDGSITPPTPEEIMRMADEYGIDGNVLIAKVNEKIAALEKSAVEGRTTQLQQMQMEANLAMPKFQKIGSATYAFSYDPASKSWKSTVVSSGNSSGYTTFKFSPDERGQLIATGMSSAQVDNLQNTINKTGFSESAMAASGALMNSHQYEVAQNILTGKNDADTVTSVLNMGDDAFEVWFNGHVDSDGFLDPSKLPDVAAGVAMNRASSLGLIDTEDEETKSFLDSISGVFDNLFN